MIQEQKEDKLNVIEEETKYRRVTMIHARDFNIHCALDYRITCGVRLERHDE